MRFAHIAMLCESWGWRIKPQEYLGFKEYFERMLGRERVMIMMNDGFPCAILTFFLTNDYESLYKKSEWATPIDDETGSQIYVDKMVSSGWTPTLRRKVQETIEERFPNVMEGYYHRAPYDRCVKIYRRRQKCTK